MRIKNSKTLFQINSIAIRLKPIGKRKKVSQRISKSDSSQQNIPQIHLMHTCVCLFCQLNAYHHSQRRNITHLSKHLNSASLGRVSPDKRQQAKGSQRGKYFKGQQTIPYLNWIHWIIPELDLFPALITLKVPLGTSEHTSEQRLDAIRQGPGVIPQSIRSTIFQAIFFFWNAC